MVFLRLLEPIVAGGGAPLGTIASEIERIDALLSAQRAGASSIEEAVTRFVAERGVCDASAYPDLYKRMALASVDEFVVPFPGIGAMLAALRAVEVGYALLTNGWVPLQKRKAERVGFDGPVIASAAIGAQKPQRAAFDALARVLRLPHAEIWYLGDSPRADVAGAKAAGMRGAWFDAEGASYPADLAAPDAVIHSLHEVPALFRP